MFLSFDSGDCLWKLVRSDGVGMIFRRVLLIVACLLCLSAVGCAKRYTSYDGLLYYTVEELSRFRVESMDQDGGNQTVVLGEIPNQDVLVKGSMKGVDETKLENKEAYARQPSVARDGGKIVYLAGSPPAVRVFNLRTKSEELLVGGKETFDSPSFSRVRDELVYLRRGESRYSDLMVQLSPSAPRRVLHARNLEHPAWSNLSDMVYVVSTGEDGVPWLYSLKTDGSQSTKLIANATQCCMAPDGVELAVIADDKLQIYDIMKRTMRVVVEESGISSPTWNPAGNMLAYVRENHVFKVSSMSGEPEAVGDPNKVVVDVCWAKGP